MQTQEEILAEMDAAQADFPVLATLDSTSDVAFWSQMRKMFALLKQTIQATQDQFFAKVEELIKSASVGSIAWYVEQAKLFQLGDAPIIQNGRMAYDVVDEQKRIIVQAAISEDLNSGRLTLKVAKKTDGLVPLALDELEAVKSYVGKVKYAGVVVDVISIEADQVKLIATVKVDRQVLTTTGTLLSDSSKYPIREAIAAYLAYLPFDAVLSVTGLTDAIQKVKGVKDFTVTSSFSRRPISDTWVAFSREITSPAGHMQLHADSIISYTY